MRVLVVAVLVGVTFSQTARAEEPTPEQELREEAYRLWDDDRLVDARDRHLTLWRLKGRSMDAFNIGMISSRIHDWTMAAEYLTLWLDMEPPQNPPDPELARRRREEARIDLDETLKHVGALVVQVSEPGAEVLVDGRSVGTSPLRYPVFVNPGEHRLVAKLGEARGEEVTVKAEAGREQTVRLGARAKPEPAVVKARAPAPERGAPEPAQSGAPIVSSRGAAFLAVGVGSFGIGLTMAALFVHSDATEQGSKIRNQAGVNGCRQDAFRDACDDLRDKIMARDALAGGAVVSFVAAGGLAAASAVADWMEPAKPARQGIRVLPAVGSAGVVVQGVW